MNADEILLRLDPIVATGRGALPSHYHEVMEAFGPEAMTDERTDVARLYRCAEALAKEFGRLERCIANKDRLLAHYLTSTMPSERLLADLVLDREWLAQRGRRGS